MYYYDPTYLLLIPGLLLALYAQFKVTGTFNKWKQVGSRTGMTGAEMARRILDANGCRDVRVEYIQGSLTDHYDPQNGVLRLSSEVYGSRS
ncbi:MAG: zinc metallopeptidase, partial [Clostridia bacterium]|nr:zinc metallopeptidase [Clostridia bacterium]